MKNSCFLSAKRVRNRKIVIWGSGVRGTEIQRLLKQYAYNIDAYVDSNESKIGKTKDGLHIYAPDYLIGKVTSTFVVIAMDALHEEIKNFLCRHDYAEKADFFWIKRTVIEPELIDGYYQDDFGNSVKSCSSAVNLYLALIGRDNKIVICDDAILKGNISITLVNGSVLTIRNADLLEGTRISIINRSTLQIEEKSSIDGYINVRNNSHLVMKNINTGYKSNINIWENSSGQLLNSVLDGICRIGAYSSIFIDRVNSKEMTWNVLRNSRMTVEKTEIKDSVEFSINDMSQLSVKGCIFEKNSRVAGSNHAAMEFINSQIKENEVKANNYSDFCLTDSSYGEKVYIAVNEQSRIVICGMKVVSTARILCHHNSYIQIGKNCGATKNLYILVNHGSILQIGEDCAIANDVTILSGDSHPVFQIDCPQKYEAKSVVTIDDHVWLGKGCVVLGDSFVGESSIVAPNSVIGKSYPNNCLLMGYPARVIKQNIAYDLNENDPDQILNKKYWKVTEFE